MNKKKLFTLLAFFLFCSLFSWGQILYNDQGKAFGEDPFFNEDFIRQNRISRLSGEYSAKKEMEPIKPRHEKVIYDFEESGKLKFIGRIRGKIRAEKDTSMIYFAYGKSGEILARRRSDAGGFYSLKYEYDDQGRVIKETYYRSQNTGKHRMNFIEGNEIIVNSETFRYEEKPNQVHKTIFNSAGKPYQQEVIVYDNWGYLTEIRSSYIITNKTFSKEFLYNEKGLTSSVKEISIAGDITLRTFTYDMAGNILEEEVYKNGEHVEHREFLYEGETMLLKAILTKELATNIIRILQFSYEFFED